MSVWLTAWSIALDSWKLFGTWGRFSKSNDTARIVASGFAIPNRKQQEESKYDRWITEQGNDQLDKDGDG